MMGNQRSGDTYCRFCQRQNLVLAALIDELVCSSIESEKGYSTGSVICCQRRLDFNDRDMCDHDFVPTNFVPKPEATLLFHVALYKGAGIAEPNHTRGPRISMIVSDIGFPLTLIGSHSESGFSKSCSS